MSFSSKRVGIIILVLAVVALGTLPGLATAQTQSSADPIIMVTNGDLWSWSGPDQPMEQLTSWGMNERLALSPDGTHVAYWSGATVFVDWLKTLEGGAGGFDPPGNIWMLHIPSGETYRVADQPAGAIFTGPNDDDPGLYALRKRPIWSPDGQQLAWIEIIVDNHEPTGEVPAGTVQLVIYDLASGTTRILHSFVVANGAYRVDQIVFNVAWGAPGIFMKARVPESGISTNEFRIYNPQDEFFLDVALADDAPEWLYSADWIDDAGEHLADVWHPSTRRWLDWHTGRIEVIPETLELVSAITPEAARFTFDDDTWHLTFPGQAAIDLGEDVRPYGISRDGQWVVYGRYGKNPANGYYETMVIVESSNSQIVLGWRHNPQLVWGPLSWRIQR